MAGQKVSALTRLLAASLDDLDEVLIVDKSDTSMASSGTTKYIRAIDLHADLQSQITALDSSTSSAIDALQTDVADLTTTVSGFTGSVDDALATAEAYTDAPPDATTVAGTAYTFGTADAGNTIVETTSASNQVLTVPGTATTTFPVGSVIEVARIGAGTVTFAPGTNVSFQSVGGTVISSQYGVATLRRRSGNTWHLVIA